MHIVAVDMRNMMYKAAHVGRNLSASSGRKTGAIHGVLSGMLAVKRRYPGSKFAVVWDGLKTDNSWRNKLFPGYKAHRRGAEVTDEMRELRASVNSQVEILRRLFDAIGVTQVEVETVEADDVVGMLSAGCNDRKWRITVFSSDQDYLQLMPFGVEVITGSSAPVVTDKEINAKWRCGSVRLAKLRALLGDASDGIPRAVSGVGPVAAARYIEAGVDPSVPSFDALPRSVRQNAERLKVYWPAIHTNWRLMRILRSCEDTELSLSDALRCRTALDRVFAALEGKPSRDKDGYGEMLGVFAELELAVAIENRHLIWRLQLV